MGTGLGVAGQGGSVRGSFEGARRPGGAYCGIRGGGFLEERYLRDGSWKPKAALLLEKKGQLYLTVAFKKQVVPPCLPSRSGGFTVVGIDRGLRSLVAARAVEYKPRQQEDLGVGVVLHRPLLFCGGEAKQKRRSLVVRARLQRRGTRSARRRLQVLRGDEKQFFLTASRVIAKQVLTYALQFPHPVLVLEDLTHITERVVGKQGKHKGQEKDRDIGPGESKNKELSKTGDEDENKDKKKGLSRRLRGELSSWHHRLLQEALLCKVEELGVPAVFVNPAYSSQTCPRCGHVSRKNRRGNRFLCEQCWYQNNADIDISAATIVGKRLGDWLHSHPDLDGEVGGVCLRYPTPQHHHGMVLTGQFFVPDPNPSRVFVTKNNVIKNP